MVPDNFLYSNQILKNIMNSILQIIENFDKDVQKAFQLYLDFVKTYRSYFENQIPSFRDTTSIGFISPRLFRDPLSVDLTNNLVSLEERKSFVFEYVKAILLLIYCLECNIEGWNLNETIFYTTNHKLIQSKSNKDLIQLFQALDKTLNTTSTKKDSKKINKTKIERRFTNFDIDQYKDQDSLNDILFTARLTAFYRSQESKGVNPLVIDTFAEELVGNLNDFKMNHSFSAQRGDYGIVRTYFIDQLLKKWSETSKDTQIVLLGAGLDTRVYRLPFLKDKIQMLYEIDIESIIQYKEKILQKYNPFCPVTRLSIDLSTEYWFKKLLGAGFSQNIPTLWILEGLVYYLEKKQVISLLKTLYELSSPESKVFFDVCVPALADLKFGFFTKYFKWGVQIFDIPELFKETSWKLTSSYADDHDQGRDVGQRGLIFTEGVKN